MAEKPLIRAGVYQHFKGGIYKVIGIATHSETLEKVVVYRQQGDEHGLWVRPLEMFREQVEVNGQKVPRFKFLRN